MKFARYVFIGAGVWGLAVLPPLYALLDISGRRYAVPVEYPQFFYGFVGVALAWQIGFLLIGSDPIRYRPFMLVGILEKMSYVATLTALYAAGRLAAVDVQPLVPDLALGLLFVAAFWKTRSPRPATTPGR